MHLTIPRELYHHSELPVWRRGGQLLQLFTRAVWETAAKPHRPDALQYLQTLSWRYNTPGIMVSKDGPQCRAAQSIVPWYEAVTVGNTNQSRTGVSAQASAHNLQVLVNRLSRYPQALGNSANSLVVRIATEDLNLTSRQHYLRVETRSHGAQSSNPHPHRWKLRVIHLLRPRAEIAGLLECIRPSACGST